MLTPLAYAKPGIAHTDNSKLCTAFNIFEQFFSDTLYCLLSGLKLVSNCLISLIEKYVLKCAKIKNGKFNCFYIFCILYDYFIIFMVIKHPIENGNQVHF